jgi:hypothetical protein
LTVPHGKALVAKELGAWAGADNYYHDHDEQDFYHDHDEEEESEADEKEDQGNGAVNASHWQQPSRPPQRQPQRHEPHPHFRRRYLALDHHALSMNSRDVNHQPPYLRAILSLLVGVAKATGRTLILPAVFHDAFYVFAWNHLDLKSVSAARREREGEEGTRGGQNTHLRTIRLD